MFQWPESWLLLQLCAATEKGEDCKGGCGPINKTVKTVKQFCSSRSRREDSVRDVEVEPKCSGRATGLGSTPLKPPCVRRGQVEDRGMTSCRGKELTGSRGWRPGKGEAGGTATGLGELRAQESLNGRIDVPSCGNQGLQVSLPVDEAHGVELI